MYTKKSQPQTEMSLESGGPVDWAGGQCSYQDGEGGKNVWNSSKMVKVGRCVCCTWLSVQKEPLRLWKEAMWSEQFKTIPEAVVEYGGRLSINLWQDLKLGCRSLFSLLWPDTQEEEIQGIKRAFWLIIE